MQKKENIYKLLRESTETDSCPALTQEELSSIFSNEGNPVGQSTISKIEASKKDPPTQSIAVLKAYSTHFHVTCDYLLGISENKYANENYQMITRITGLNDESIENLKKINQGNDNEDFFETLNYLIGSDFQLFTRFIDSIGLYFDDTFNTSMTYENNVFVPINNLQSPILYQQENEVYVGKYDNTLCNGDGGYHVKCIPI